MRAGIPRARLAGWRGSCSVRRRDRLASSARSASRIAAALGRHAVFEGGPRQEQMVRRDARFLLASDARLGACAGD